MQEFKPPFEPENSIGRLKVFVGGSIENGAAEDWQKKLSEFISTRPYSAYIDYFNPRRDDWHPEWPNDYNFPPFKQQVDWELKHQKDADLIVYYFAGNTMSPITLLELGLFYDRKPVVGYDPAYKRVGNLEITKDHFPMDIHQGWDSFIKALDARLEILACSKGFIATPRSESPAPQFL